jgi:hypothetical protein
VAVVLLMRLTETLVIWLSEDQDFWDAIEDGESRLGPIGLQQVRSHRNYLFCRSCTCYDSTELHFLLVQLYGLCSFLYDHVH